MADVVGGERTAGAAFVGFRLEHEVVDQQLAAAVEEQSEVEMDTKQRSGCPVNVALEVLGDRWSLIVLRDIMYKDRRHFRELQRESEEGIASNILSSRLRRLVAAGLLTRDDAGAGQRATYSLTAAAIELVPLLAELGWWGLRHRPTDAPLRARAERLYHGGPEMWQDFMDELRERHLGVPKPETGRPSVIARLDAEDQPPRSKDGKKITSPTVM